MQELKKITQPNGQLLLYPVPVIKEKKFLLLAHNELQAAILISGFAHGIIKIDACVKVTTHSDGATPIYQLDLSDKSIPLLNQREKNIERAQQLETILCKHMWNLFQADAQHKSQMQNKLWQMYSNQTSCSSCIELGIQAEQLATFMEEVCFKV